LSISKENYPNLLDDLEKALSDAHNQLSNMGMTISLSDIREQRTQGERSTHDMAEQ
jgi:hypothetical protein